MRITSETQNLQIFKFSNFQTQDLKREAPEPET